MNETRSATPAAYDVAKVRADFPALSQRPHGRPLVYLDTAATAQRPRAVLDAMEDFYVRYNANVHRGVYLASEEATTRYEGVRAKVAGFLGVEGADRVVYTRGCTDAINLVARGYLEPRLAEGDRILVARTEHHANIVPWQLVASAKGAAVEVIEVDDRGDILLDAYAAQLDERVKMVAVGHVSNALGTVHPVARIIELAHAQGIPVTVDGAQSAPHIPLSVDALDADFFTGSAHKMLGPTGVGFLIGRASLLEEMVPMQGGGDMIRTVTFEGTTFADPPHRFEAGTPAIAEVIGFGAALEYLESIGRDAAHQHENTLLAHARASLDQVTGVRRVGNPRMQAAVISFVVEGTNPQDIATLLDQDGIAVRVGHHCAQPALRHFGVESTVRLSLGPYNTVEEIEHFVAALEKVRRILSL